MLNKKIITYTMEIIESIKLFNECHKDRCGTSVSLLKYLDKNCPEWRKLINDEEFWNRIIDFPESVDFAIAVCEKGPDKNHALKFLAANLVENWRKYPKNVKNDILKEYEDVVKTKCKQQIWDSLSTIHKLTLVHHIIVNEYNYVRDLMTLYEYLTTEEGCKLPVITSDIRMLLDKIHHHPNQFQYRDEAHFMDDIRHRLCGGFDRPTVDYESLEYTPSEQLRRFLLFAEEGGDTMIADELKSARLEIEHSFLDIRHQNRHYR